MRGNIPTAVACGIVTVVALACGRSEQVGWQDREDVTADSRAAAGPRGDTARSGRQPAGPPPGSPQAVMLEYQQLAQALEPIRARAMEDSAITSRWEQLDAAVEDRMVEKDPFVSQLLGRAEEIEEHVAEVEARGDTLTNEERATLGEQWQNIQGTLGQARSQVFREPEFARRLEGFQAALYDRMRELAPDRSEEIGRLETLGERILAILDSVSRVESGATADSMTDTEG